MPDLAQLSRDLQSISIDELHHRVRTTTDALGRRIDAEVFAPVMALNAWGVVTLSSCGGHTARALPYPWIDVHDAAALEALLAERPLDGWAIWVSPGGTVRLLPNMARPRIGWDHHPDTVAAAGKVDDAPHDAELRVALLDAMHEHRRQLEVWAHGLLDAHRARLAA